METGLTCHLVEISKSDTEHHMLVKLDTVYLTHLRFKASAVGNSIFSAGLFGSLAERKETPVSRLKHESDNKDKGKIRLGFIDITV